MTFKCQNTFSVSVCGMISSTKAGDFSYFSRLLSSLSRCQSAIVRFTLFFTLAFPSRSTDHLCVHVFSSNISKQKKQVWIVGCSSRCGYNACKCLFWVEFLWMCDYAGVGIVSPRDSRTDLQRFTFRGDWDRGLAWRTAVSARTGPDSKLSVISVPDNKEACFCHKILNNSKQFFRLKILTFPRYKLRIVRYKFLIQSLNLKNLSLFIFHLAILFFVIASSCRLLSIASYLTIHFFFKYRIASIYIRILSLYLAILNLHLIFLLLLFVTD